MSKKKMKVTPFEIVWYSLTGAVAVWGLVYVILGLIAAFYPATTENNPLAQADKVMVSNFGLGFLYWGLIILAIGVVAMVIILCVFAKSTDRELEKTQRRAARLAAARKEETTPEVVDAQVEPKAE